MTATAHINGGCIRFDQFQLAIEGRYFLTLGTSTFTLHSSFGSFNAQVVGLADVRVKFTRSPTGSSLPPPSSFKELESQNSCHQAPIRRTSEPYSCSGMLHSRYEIGHCYQATHCAGFPFATALRATTSAQPADVFMSHPKKARLSWILVLEWRNQACLRSPGPVLLRIEA